MSAERDRPKAGPDCACPPSYQAKGWRNFEGCPIHTEANRVRGLLLNAGFRHDRFRADGWPLCPRCGEDEVYTLGGDPCETPTLVDLLVHAACYRCGQLLPRPVPVVRPANLVEMVEAIHRRIDRYFSEHDVLPREVELAPAEWRALLKAMSLGESPAPDSMKLSYRGRLFDVRPVIVH